MIQSKRGFRSLTLPLRLAGSVALVALMPVLAAGSAFAQTADQSAQAPTQTETIQVTGTRIKNTDAQSANPITVVSSEDITKSEAVTIEQFLRKLPDIDFTGGISQNDNNGGNGASNLGLRNLGPQRTLILVNGYRFPLTDSQASANAVDLNNIPTSMIDHIEILRDGASSAYGADAVGGVINIITKQHFNGVEIGGTVGETSYGDGLRYGVYSTVGSDFERGNILINVSHDHQDEISSGDRAWAINEHPEAGPFAYDSGSGRIPGAQGVVNPGGLNGGSPTKFYWYGTGSNAGNTNPILAANAFTLGNPIAGGAFAGGALPPGVIAFPGGLEFDYLPTEGLVSGLDRTQINLTTHYDLLPNVTAVLEAFYTDRKSQESLNPEPIGAGTPTPQFPSAFLIPVYLQNGQLNPANPTNNPAYAATLIANGAGPNEPVALSTRRFENGDRLYSDDITTYRIRAGLEGTAWGQYDWQVGYLYGKSDASYTILNEANFYHISQQLGINPCGTAVAQGCSIANYFGYQSLTPAQAKYSVFDNSSTTDLEMQNVYGNFSGPIYTLPAGPLTGAIGFEYRTDGINDTPNPVTAQGDAALFQLPTQGSYSTASGYVELNIPILANMPFVKTLTADVSSRYDFNTTFGRALTYKAGLDWAVTDDIRFRGNHSTGFRAPQVKELYAGVESNSPAGSDPCYGGLSALSGVVATQCALDFKESGLPTSAQPPKINQYGAYLGGNPLLKPETSSEWTFGSVFTPSFAPGVTVTADYYTVLVRNEIATYNANALVADCYEGASYVVSQTAACNLVGFGHRGADGSMGPIDTFNTNIGDELTQGIDVTTSYGFDVQKIGVPVPGNMLLTGSVNYLLKDNVTALGSTYKNAGTFNEGVNAGTAEPRWKALLEGQLVGKLDRALLWRRQAGQHQHRQFRVP
jgi:iron complex outermembrane recepter protein